MFLQVVAGEAEPLPGQEALSEECAVERGRVPQAEPLRALPGREELPEVE